MLLSAQTPRTPTLLRKARHMREHKAPSTTNLPLTAQARNSTRTRSTPYLQHVVFRNAGNVPVIRFAPPEVADLGRVPAVDEHELRRSILRVLLALLLPDLADVPHKHAPVGGGGGEYVLVRGLPRNCARERGGSNIQIALTRGQGAVKRDTKSVNEGARERETLRRDRVRGFALFMVHNRL